MSKLFDYLLPRGISTPSHQTVRRDLDILYDKLDVELNQRLMVHTVSVLYYTQVNCVWLLLQIWQSSQIAQRLQLLALLPSGSMMTGI